jgi:hypothetical protein
MQSKLGIAALALAGAVGLAGSAGAQLVRTKDTLAGCGTSTGCTIDSAVVWGDNETEVVLDGPVFVTDGGSLEIRIGVTLYGQPRYKTAISGDPRGTPGALIVTREGTLNASGLPTAAGVIIATTAAVDNDGDDVADDLDGSGFPDQYPGFVAPCVNAGLPTSPEGADNLLGTADDELGTCVLDASPSFLDDSPRTAPLAPLDPEGNQNNGLWGGVVILGNAPTSLDGSDDASLTIGQGVVEGLPFPGYSPALGTYGGAEPHDSSGRFEYVSVRHAGDEIDDANELNGVTLGAVGDGTIFRFVEIYANFDDGIEWFGGTLNSHHLVVGYVGDDSLDVDEGYTGTVQFALSITPFFNEYDCANASCTGGGLYGTASGDSAGEIDGDNCAGECNLAGPDSFSSTGNAGVAPLPMAAGLFYNWTNLGNALNLLHASGALKTPEYDPSAALCTGAGTPFPCCSGSGTGFCTNSLNRGAQMRNGFAGELRNSYFVNNGTQEGYDLVPGGATPGWNTSDNVCADTSGDGIGDLVRVVASTFDDVAALPASANDCTLAAGGNERNAMNNGDAITPGAPGAGTDNIVNDVVVSTGLAVPGLGVRGLANEDITFDPRGDASGKLAASLKPGGAINPRPFGAAGLVGGISPGGHSVPSPDVTFRGAFPSSGTLWTTDWTALNLGGILVD